jgi:1-acyl-sn-glycerol-3-phosphate acyltransferase
MIDILMLYRVPLNFRWVSRSEIRMTPFIGQYLMLHGDILIPRDNPRKAAAMVMNDGGMWLRERGVSVAIFPEGTRSKTGEMGRFRSGAFALAHEAGVGILPVVLTGSRFIGRRGGLPWRHDFGVRVLEPVSAGEVAARDPKEIMEETRERMVAARDEMING